MVPWGSRDPFEAQQPNRHVLMFERAFQLIVIGLVICLHDLRELRVINLMGSYINLSTFPFHGNRAISGGIGNGNLQRN